MFNDNALMNANPHPARVPADADHVYRFGFVQIQGMISPTVREELYTRYIDSQQSLETCHVIDANDRTPRVTHHGPITAEGHRQYNSKCSCCYLGYTHSTALHDQAVNPRS